LRIDSLLPEKKEVVKIRPVQESENMVKDGKTLVKKGELFEYRKLGGTVYLLVWSVDSYGNGFIKKAYEANLAKNEISTSELSLETLKERLSEETRTTLENTRFEVVPLRCNNKITDKTVKYFENEPYKGQVAVLPLDLQEGWYVGVPPYRKVGLINREEALRAYDDSGKARRFYICNVGNNGRTEFANSPRGDDSCCVQYFEETGTKPVIQALVGYGKTEKQAYDLLQKVFSALMSAAQQYGQKYVTISGIGTLTADVQPLLPAAECEDFMSALNCHTLFNLCDPVLCPASRCNFAGRYHVPDVVQSGVIGSIMLCFPNYQENILVPVCLTGIHAGLDNFVMIQKALRDCLQENLETGRNVGICDEIKSIYLCEFFWKQAVPLMKYGVPWLLEKTIGGIRGGGEYLAFQDSWNKAQQSVDYFTNYYGVNAFKAFKARATSEVGTEVCRAWVSARYPSSADMFDKLLEPDSPVQFYARFSETLLSSATVPATSHYKVYFRIYAGRDQGVYYQVYFKRIPQAELYQLPEIMQVPGAVGYIPRGEQVDKAIDFTAPQGYKELCVRINGQEKCGFGQVTTSFAIDELNNLYLKEQAAAGVKTEDECVSGKPSVMPLALSLNIQAGAEEALQPAIYKRGIIRICASENPGSTTQPGRWYAVGYCDEAKKVRCWLDTESVKNTISDLELQNLTLEEAKGKTDIIDTEGLWNESHTIRKLSEANKKSEEALEKLKEISFARRAAKDIDADIFKTIQPAISSFEEIIKKGILNNYKAQTQLGIARIYHEVVKILYRFVVGIKFEREQEIKKGEYPGLDKDIIITEELEEGSYYLGKAKDGSEYLWTDHDYKWKKIEEIEKSKEVTKYYFSDGSSLEIVIPKVAKESIEVDLDKESVASHQFLKGEEIIIRFNGENYKFLLEEIKTGGVTILVSYTGIPYNKEMLLEMNQKKQFDLDESGDYLSVTLTLINYADNRAGIKFEKTSKREKDTIFFGPGSIRADCESCSRGFSICTYEECHNLGYCYIKKGLKSKCLNCRKGMKCSDFNNPYECKNNKCNLKCAWVGNGAGRCVPRYTTRNIP
jgi:hypothetical protein